MNKEQILNYLKTHKNDYLDDGIIILGLFGSFARDEANKDSDIDILYQTTEKYKEKYIGWDYFTKLDEIKEHLQNNLHQKIDIANKDTLNEIGKKYILEDVVYV